MGKIAYKPRFGRRSRLTTGGRKFLRGKQISTRARKLKKQQKDAPPEPIIVPGPDGLRRLNGEETIVHTALERQLGPGEFSAQVILGEANQLGSSNVDWIIFKIRTALEYQGPAHATTGGRAKDKLRVLERKRQGLSTVYLYAHDLPDIDKVLRDILAFPGVWVASAAGIGFY